jgi:hypothetical protein
MSRRRLVVRGLLLAYLLGGAGFTAGCGRFGMGQRWAARRLAALEDLEPLRVERIDRLRASAGPEGSLQVELDVVDDNGERDAFQLQDSRGAPVGRWSRAVVHRGPTFFAVDTPVLAVAADGSLAAEPEPLTADDRANALLVLLNEGPAHDWFLFAYSPPYHHWSGEESRAPDRAVSNYPFASWKLARPPTAASVAKRKWASLVLVPLGFAIDVVTWPAQIVVMMIVMANLGGH